MQQDDIRKQVQTNVELSYRMRNQLLRGRLLEFGHSLHDAWQSKRQFSSKISSSRLDQIYEGARQNGAIGGRSEEHTSELQSLMRISYAVFCLKKQKQQQHNIKATQNN